MSNNFVPTQLVELIAEDAAALKMTAQAGVAVAKVASNRNAPRYMEHKQFLAKMSPGQRVTLCTLVRARCEAVKS